MNSTLVLAQARVAGELTALYLFYDRLAETRGMMTCSHLLLRKALFEIQESEEPPVRPVTQREIVDTHTLCRMVEKYQYHLVWSEDEKQIVGLQRQMKTWFIDLLVSSNDPTNSGEVSIGLKNGERVRSEIKTIAELHLISSRKFASANFARRITGLATALSSSAPDAARVIEQIARTGRFPSWEQLMGAEPNHPFFQESSAIHNFVGNL